MLAIVACIAAFFMMCVDACDKLPEDYSHLRDSSQEVRP